MDKSWIGQCAVCGKTNSWFQKATYLDAPDGGVTVHPQCLPTFYKSLEDRQWKLDMEEAYRAEEERLYKQDLQAHVAFLRDLRSRASTRAWSRDSHGVATVGEYYGAKLYGARANTRNFKINDDGVDLELWLQFTTRLAWGHIDFKTRRDSDFLVCEAGKKPRTEIDKTRDEVIYVLMLHHGKAEEDVDIFDRWAEPIGWQWGRVAKTYPVTKQWLGNSADVHLVPAEELRSMDDLKRAYRGRWRWHDVPDHPLRHPKEGFPARYDV